MTIEEIFAACRTIKEAGTSSKVPVPIVTLEALARDASRWRETPAYIRDVAEAVKARGT